VTAVDDAIRLGALWLDTNGNRIRAHGGSIHYDGGIYYWYGENKEHMPASGGVRVRRSESWQLAANVAAPVLSVVGHTATPLGFSRPPM
jgi:hypothetical protein